MFKTSFFWSLLLAVLSIFLMTACTGQESVEQNDKITIYVKHTNKNQFMQKYGIDYELEHPEVKIVVLDHEYSGDQKPDLIFVGGFESYKQMVDEGLLAPLDSYLNRNRKELDFYLESMITTKGMEIFQTYTPETLYALPLSLYSGTLFYNKDLFDRYEIPYPSDFITWDEVIELAQRFPPKTVDGTPLYGLSTTALPVAFSYLAISAYFQELSLFDQTTWTMTVNTPEWRAIWEYFVPGMRAGHFQLGPDNPLPMEEHPFLLGQAAMIDHGILFIQKLVEQEQKGNVINWDVVTPPIQSRNHPKTSSYKIMESYGIASDSPNKDVVWDLLVFMIRRNPPVTEIAGRNLEHLYTLEYEYRPTVDRDISRLEFDIQQLASEQLMAVVKEEKTLDEALQQLEMIGQHILNAFRVEKEATE